jgi:hypothetical protein
MYWKYLLMAAVVLLGGSLVYGLEAASKNCSPAYPGICLPPPPPDLDCGQIKQRNFKVLPPDPHKLDGDKDGIGCEKEGD